MIPQLGIRGTTTVQPRKIEVMPCVFAQAAESSFGPETPPIAPGRAFSNSRSRSRRNGAAGISRRPRVGQRVPEGERLGGPLVDVVQDRPAGPRGSAPWAVPSWRSCRIGQRVLGWSAPCFVFSRTSSPSRSGLRFSVADGYRSRQASMTPGKRLKIYRQNAGLTQARLAELTGIPKGNLSQMEHEKRPLGKITAQKLAKILKCDYRSLL